MLKLLFIADGRSPTALNWMDYFSAQGHTVHLVSLVPCQPQMDLASLTVLPVAFSAATAAGAAPGEGAHSLKGRVLRAVATPGLRTWLRHRFVPRSLIPAAVRLAALIADVQPDLVHAMRIPYEGMLAALAVEGLPAPPLVVSVWGNDFTLHAPATRLMGQLTRLTMDRAAALHSDCYRDQRLAFAWGFDQSKPAVVLPGAGGLQLETFTPGPVERGPVVINPRGLRTYVRNDTFFKAVPLVLARHPQARFLCPAMAGQPEAEKWVASLGIGSAVDLLPRQPRARMAGLFHQARVVVSPSTHDGTPNTLLEAMACGCTPVAGDIESLREWITPGVNGLLCDPSDPKALAEAVCEALENPALQARARSANLALIWERAEYGAVMGKAVGFYRGLVGG